MPRLTLFALAALTAACATTRQSVGRTFEDLDRAEIVRCRFDESRTMITSSSVAALAGDYRLFMTNDEMSEKLSAGRLELHAPPGDRVGEAAPVLTGATDIDAETLDAMIPGDARSTDEVAPGVGVYAFDNPDRTPGLTVVVRLGAEANRSDRQRFDGAHTTLRVTSIAASRFGGTWESADGQREASGDFCAVRE